MAKIGISIRLDVTKIDKSRIFTGAKGKYIDLTTFIDTCKEGEYGDHGFVSQFVSKEERAKGVKTPILGNTKVFFIDLQQQNESQNVAQQQQQHQVQQAHNQAYKDLGSAEFIDDDIPF